ncbi:MAG: hypothetical protein WDW21_05775 [Neisseriaceae bacterium]
MSKQAKEVLVFTAGLVGLGLGSYVLFNPTFNEMLLRLIGIGLLISGLLLLIEAARLPLVVFVRNSWIVDGVLSMFFGTLFLGLAKHFSLITVVYISSIWLIYSAILQSWVTYKGASNASKIFPWILSLGIIYLSLYNLVTFSMQDSTFPITIAWSWILLGAIRISYPWVLEERKVV